VDNRAGVQTDIDLSSAVSVDDVVRLVNDAGAGVTASLNTAGNGVTIKDNTGATASNLTITDVSGTAATDLKIAQDVADDAIESGNLQLRYISTSTALAQLNGGTGVASGQFIITDSNGASATVDLTQGNEVSIADVIAEINSRGLAITARVNDNGDGIVIEDTGSGVVKLKVEESGSTTARDLGILGEAANPGDDLVGTFEKSITIAATDTLDQVVQKINDAGLNLSATVINDGSTGTPFRLSLNATKAGSAGAFVFDDGGLGLGATELSKARNAVAFYGAADPAKAIAITSTTNTLKDVVPGATIDLKSTSSAPVQVVVSQDTAAISKAAKDFVDKFNAVITVINKHDKYDPETEQRGLLLGESSVARVRSALFGIVSSRNTELSSQFSSLAQIGIKVGAGAKMEFDEAKFQAAYAADPTAVLNLFTFKQTETDSENVTTIKSAGVGVRIDELLKRLTDSEAGPVQSRIDAIDDQLELNRKRIEQIDKSLENKRARLTAEFIAMERALAELQSQGSALANFQPLQIQQPRQQ
jgi:flagellar hook-associated protein 2